MTVIGKRAGRIMSEKQTKVLIVGESAYMIHVHFKGFASYESGYLSQPMDGFLKRFADTSVHFDFMPNHEVSRAFPLRLEEMQRYDVIVISDAPADSFLLHPDTLAGEILPNRLALIGDYVRAGGGFAMIGGWMSFAGFHGKAHYAYSPLAALLPVEIATGDDRMETPEGVHPEALAPGHSIFKGIDGPWPDFLGYNRFAARRGDTLLRFRENGDPLLVVEKIGNGRVACFASDIQPHWGSPRFQKWPHYTRFWEQLMAWLAGRLA
jgi:uncharacterized membrane protein